MLNVLLVDDEKLERVLIRKGYNWEENAKKIKITKKCMNLYKSKIMRIAFLLYILYIIL